MCASLQPRLIEDNSSHSLYRYFQPQSTLQDVKEAAKVKPTKSGTN